MAPRLAGHSRVRRWVNASAALVLGGGIALIPVAANAAPVVLYDMQTNGAWTTAAGSTWVAESFTSGPQASTLSSVSVHIRNANASNSGSVPSTVTVSLYTSSGGQPGSKVADLTSKSIGAWGEEDVTASPGTALAASTQYFIVVTGSNGGTIGWKYASTTPTTDLSPAPTFTALRSTDGGSSWSAAPGPYYWMTVSSTAATAPAAPTLNSLTPGSTTLGVNATLGSDGGSPVTDVEYSTDGGTGWTSSGQTTGSFTISGLTNGQSYSVRVRAVNAVGTGAQSNALSGTPVGVPGAPTLNSLTPGSTTLGVNATLGGTGGSPITDVEYSTDGGTGWTSSGQTTGSFTITGLTNGQSYSVRVRAVNAVGTGAQSNALSGTPVSRPLAPTLNSLTPGSTTLGVNATLGGNGGSAITDVEYSTDGGGSWSSSGQTTGSFTITGLTNGQSYSVRVRAVNAVGNGAQSNALSGTPLGRPGAPTGVTATAGDGEAEVSWSAPAATGGSPILSYTATSTPGSLTCTTSTTTCTVTGLTNDISYTFRVTATNAQGTGTASVASSAVTPTAPPPPSPSPTPSPSPSASASGTPSPSASTPQPTSTSAESARPTAQAPADGPSPSAAPTASASPSELPSTSASASASAIASTTPSPAPSATTSLAPSGAPSLSPSAAPEPSPSSALPPPGQSILTDDAQFGPVLTLDVNLEIGAPAAGRSATISANGLAADSAVEIRIYSEPRVIGSGTADANGSATVATEIPTDLEPGTHTIMALGTAPNGQPVQSIGAFSLSSDSLVTAVAPPGQVATPMEPGDPQLERALAAGKPVYDVALFPSVTATVALAGAAVVGLAGIGGLVGDPSGQRSSERGKLAGVVTKKLKALKPVEPGPGDLSRSWAMPGTATTDRWISVVPQKAGRFTALLPRLMVDGSWARAMLGSLAFALWVLGGVLGFISSASVGFQSLSPSLPLMVAIIVLGVLDAAAGAIAWGVMFLCALVTGHVTNFYDLRTMLGLFVIFASIPLLAHAIRPLRRKVATTRMERFDQIADYVMPPVFLAFAAASMFKALNGLSGLELVDKADVIWIQLLVAGAYLLRRGLEDVATYAYPQRSAEVQPQKLTSPGTGLTWVSVVLRVLIFIIVAAPFFGLGWITMLAALLTAVPMVLKIYEDKLPNSVPLNKWYPRGVFRFAILLVLGIYVSAWMLGQNASDDTVRQTYNIILLPGIIAALFELFGREGWEWPDTWQKRAIGFGIWAFAVLVVTGLISLT